MYLEEKRTADSQHTSGIRKMSTKGAYAWHLTYPRGEITEWRRSAVSQDFSFWAVFAMWFHRINPESCAPLRRWCCLAGGLSLPQRHVADKDGTGTGTDRGVVARVQLHIWNKVMYSRHQVNWEGHLMICLPYYSNLFYLFDLHWVITFEWNLANYVESWNI